MAYTNEALGKALEDLTIAYNNFLSGFVQSAIEAMTTTVIAEINEEAKNYIAGQLATQKAELEQAIENAKIALDNQKTQAIAEINSTGATQQQELANLIAVAEQVLDDKIGMVEQVLDDKITMAEQVLDFKVGMAKQALDNEVTNAKHEITSAVGLGLMTINQKINGIMAQAREIIKQNQIEYFKNNPYIQLPKVGNFNGTPSPDTVYSFDGFHWKELAYGGAFFRANGGNALDFNSEMQGDAIRNLVGSTMGFIHEDGNSTSDGVFRHSKDTGGEASRSDGNASYHLSFSASRVVPTASENRPKNYTIILWILEAI